MNKPFTTKDSWDDFDNTLELTDFQKYRIKKRFKRDIGAFIQKIIDDSVTDKTKRREELNSHNDPSDPFILDIGGEG